MRFIPGWRAISVLYGAVAALRIINGLRHTAHTRGVVEGYGRGLAQGIALTSGVPGGGR